MQIFSLQTVKFSCVFTVFMLKYTVMQEAYFCMNRQENYPDL